MEPEDHQADDTDEEPEPARVVESPGSYIAPPLPDVSDDRRAEFRESARTLFGGAGGGQRPSDERAFRVIELHLDADGRVRADLRFELTTKVYKRATALRYVTHEARKMEASDSVLVLLGPTGQAVTVVASGSGRKAPIKVANRAKKMVRELLPDLAPQRRRRTSRAPSKRRPRQTRTRQRRTSRGKARIRRSRGGR